MTSITSVVYNTLIIVQGSIFSALASTIQYGFEWYSQVPFVWYLRVCTECDSGATW